MAAAAVINVPDLALVATTMLLLDYSKQTTTAAINSLDSAPAATTSNNKKNISVTHLLRTASVCVEINMARDDTYQFSLTSGGRGGKQMRGYNHNQLLKYIVMNKKGVIIKFTVVMPSFQSVTVSYFQQH